MYLIVNILYLFVGVKYLYNRSDSGLLLIMFSSYEQMCKEFISLYVLPNCICIFCGIENFLTYCKEV